MKKHTIRIDLGSTTNDTVMKMLLRLTQREINDLARKHGSPVRKYKAMTAFALAAALNKPTHNLTVKASIHLSYPPTNHHCHHANR